MTHNSKVPLPRRPFSSALGALGESSAPRLLVLELRGFRLVSSSSGLIAWCLVPSAAPQRRPLSLPRGLHCPPARPPCPLSPGNAGWLRCWRNRQGPLGTDRPTMVPRGVFKGRSLCPPLGPFPRWWWRRRECWDEPLQLPDSGLCCSALCGVMGGPAPPSGLCSLLLLPRPPRPATRL